MACSGPNSALDPAGPAAAAIARTWWLMLAGAVAVWALVLVLLWAALSRRVRRQAPERGLRMILAGGVVLPTVVLIALLVYGTLTSSAVTGLRDNVDARIEVVGRQWQWEFRHLDGAGVAVASAFDTLVLPRGRMVEFQVRSEDVIHSFWIPRLGGKVDAIPGRVNTLRLRADQASVMGGHCAEFCGLQHAHMEFEVRVVEPEAYDAWRRAQGMAARTATATEAAR